MGGRAGFRHRDFRDRAGERLARLPPGQYHPFQLDTFGIGAVLREIEKFGAQRLILGLGGSATNDGGFGWRGRWDGFSATVPERKSGPGPGWTGWPRRSAGAPARFRADRRRGGRVESLLGPRGATRVYGRKRTAARRPGQSRGFALPAWPKRSGRAPARPRTRTGRGRRRRVGLWLKAFAGGESGPARRSSRS
jgi:hypothetical protein